MIRIINYYFFVLKQKISLLEHNLKLYNIFINKKNNFTIDFICPFLGTPKNINSYLLKRQVIYRHEKEIIYCLYKIDYDSHEDRYFAYYNIEGYNDRKKIKDCKWKEFKELYGDSLLDIILLHKD